MKDATCNPLVFFNMHNMNKRDQRLILLFLACVHILNASRVHFSIGDKKEKEK